MAEGVGKGRGGLESKGWAVATWQGREWMGIRHHSKTSAFQVRGNYFYFLRKGFRPR
jgi:hypothetical protein